jgi:hypothetical protein
MWRKSTNERQGKPKQMRLTEESLELVRVIKEASRNFIFFSLSRQAKNFQKTFAHVHKVLI